MSIASVSNRWLNRLYKILAIMLVLLAVLISAFRLFLPYVENYKQDFQNYINTKNKTNIVIGGLGMSWQLSGPTLIANNVTLVETNGAYVYVDHLEVEIDFWATLTRRNLISNNLILDGAVVTLQKNIWRTQAKDVGGAQQLDGFERITDIFLNQINRFSLKNSNIAIENESLTQQFRVNNLDWLNLDDRHQAQGNIIVDELSSNNLSLKIDIHGHSIDELEGIIYVDANHLDITPWLDNILTIDNDKIKTDISFSAWLQVHNGGVERLQLSLNDNFISWQENTQNDDEIEQKSHLLKLSAGQLLLVEGKEPESFKLYSTPMLLQLDTDAVEEYTVQMTKTAQEYYIYLSYLDLSLISHLSPLFIESPSKQALMSNLNISGQARDAFLKKTALDIQAVANFSDVSTHYSQGIPGVDNVSGSLSYNQQHLTVELAADQGALDFNKHLVAPVPYDSLKAIVDLSIMDTGWRLKVNDVELSSSELVLAADLTIDSPVNSAMTMALLANITDGDASKTGHYYPLTAMSDNLVTYLNSALIDGKIHQAQVLINGELGKFPFIDNSGTFIVDAELEEAKFKFNERWPTIADLSANLNFTNNSMLITGRSGSLAGLNVAGVQVAIDDLTHDQVLTVDTLIEDSAATSIANLMTQSSLKNSVGSVLQQLNIGGKVNGEFHLALPIGAPDGVVASGIVNFANNTVSLQAPRMDFKKVNGQLTFENDLITTSNLSLTWLGLPLEIAVNGIDKADYYDTNIALKADWHHDAWLQHISPHLQKYFDGQLQLQGDLSLYQHHGGGFSYQLNIDSNLEPLEIKIPEPYNKLAKIKTPLQIEVKGQLEESVFNATYGDKLSFFGVLDHRTNHFSRAHIVLGNEKMLLPMNGFHITSDLEDVVASEWQPFITDIINSTSQVKKTLNADGTIESTTGLFSNPERIRGTIDNLAVLGQNLHNVSFNLLDKTHWWLLELNAKETRSQIKIYPNWLEQGLDVNADFLHLTSKTVSSLSEEVTQEDDNSVVTELTSEKVFANIPEMNFVCERCLIGDLNLGSVKFDLLRADNKVIKIENFQAKREQAEFNLSGEWQKIGDISKTTVSGSLSLKNIEYELEQLGYASIIRDSGGKLDFNLNWQGGPQHFELSQLNGDLKADIDDGYLADVSDKARIFSVLSLQSIVRKLTLDFRDIFSDGMFYKDIEGDYHIKEGVLYTDNTRMNGSAGNLYIKGNTSFVNNTLDYKMSYKPNLTSSLPVLAWIATLNPVVFLAGVAIDQVITSQVVSEFNFELTGDVSDPNFKEVNRKSRDVSVGRSTPPEFVDNVDKIIVSPEDKINTKSFKEHQSPNLLEQEYKQDPYNDNKPLEELNDD
ncbi:YhdP family protein [Colwellia sp. 6_MG-2023]|uniref:YhdP family protein n=1 Tax=Colwellia sp. 6_MG-2023 TaxID=3062676 RepID=UPI0026E23506|nr:YhdP family protein [Colwellia sp. 6_MG-2023]MDO6486407.1 YhdP family protein [Colwellia sp. 6_MG-2023]